MAKVEAEFLIRGTIDDINFVVTADGQNYARAKGKTGITTTQFINNPIFDRIRNHSQEFGHCAKNSVIFRQLASRFNNLAKDGSFAGRANKLLFEILQEDNTNPQGSRTLANGLKNNEAKTLLLYFESNKLRPLNTVLKIEAQYNPANQTVILPDFLAAQDVDWPHDATHLHMATATSNWDFENGTFNTCYSNEIILDKESTKQTIKLTTNVPYGTELHLKFLYIGFAVKERKKYKLLHRKNNTATIIGYHHPKQSSAADQFTAVNT